MSNMWREDIINNKIINSVIFIYSTPNPMKLLEIHIKILKHLEDVVQ